MKTEIQFPKILIALHSTDGYRLKNQGAENSVSGNSEILPNGPDQVRTLQLATSKCRFQRTQNRRPFGTIFRKCRQERLQVLLDSLRQMTAGFSGIMSRPTAQVAAASSRPRRSPSARRCPMTAMRRAPGPRSVLRSVSGDRLLAGGVAGRRISLDGESVMARVSSSSIASRPSSTTSPTSSCARTSGPCLSRSSSIEPSV